MTCRPQGADALGRTAKIETCLTCPLPALHAACQSRRSIVDIRGVESRFGIPSRCSMQSPPGPVPWPAWFNGYLQRQGALTQPLPGGPAKASSWRVPLEPHIVSDWLQKSTAMRSADTACCRRQMNAHVEASCNLLASRHFHHFHHVAFYASKAPPPTPTWMSTGDEM